MVLLFFLIIRIRLHVFVALLISSMVVGAAAGMSLGDIIKSITEGMGDTLAEVALIVALGTVFGKMLEASGGATILAETLLGRFGASKSRSAMAIAGYITGIPVFFNAGLVILAPAIYGLKNKSNKSIMFFYYIHNGVNTFFLKVFKCWQ